MGTSELGRARQEGQMAKKSIIIRTGGICGDYNKTDEVLLESIIAVHDTYKDPFRTVLILEGGVKLKCAEDPQVIRRILHDEGMWNAVELPSQQPV